MTDTREALARLIDPTGDDVSATWVKVAADRILAAGWRPPEPQARAGEETGWLIEHGDPAPSPYYWQAGGWTSYHLEATRFARKVDAKQVADRLLKGVVVRVCEHSWLQRVQPATVPATAPGHTDMVVDPETLDAFMEANPLPQAAPVAADDSLEAARLWTTGQYTGLTDRAAADDFARALLAEHARAEAAERERDERVQIAASVQKMHEHEFMQQFERAEAAEAAVARLTNLMVRVHNDCQAPYCGCKTGCKVAAAYIAADTISAPAPEVPDGR